jgi:hypothetical protein
MKDSIMISVHQSSNVETAACQNVSARLVCATRSMIAETTAMRRTVLSTIAAKRDRPVIIARILKLASRAAVGQDSNWSTLPSVWILMNVHITLITDAHSCVPTHQARIFFPFLLYLQRKTSLWQDVVIFSYWHFFLNLQYFLVHLLLFLKQYSN